MQPYPVLRACMAFWMFAFSWGRGILEGRVEEDEEMGDVGGG